MNLNSRFPQKRILITGGASGLGKAIAMEFASQGWNIAFTDLNKKRIAETEAELKQKGVNVKSFVADSSSRKDWEKISKQLFKEWNGIDILVNNAGIGVGGDFERIPLEEWDKIIDVNLKGPVIGTHYFISDMIKKKSGYIINIASSAAFASLPDMVPYNVVKAGLMSFSESMRIELSKYNIGVSCVAPTFFKSNLGETAFAPDEKMRKSGTAMVEKAKYTPDMIASHIWKAVSKEQFYIITQWDGRFIWRFKRRMPEIYFKVMSYLYKKGLFEKFV